jgi:glycosyltransferase involved in cell wall biosynthesis
VSVVVPTYRRPHVIQSVVDPLLDDPATTEVIVVVDGCPDGSMEIVERLAAGRPRLRGVYIENSGDMAARDAGARAAASDVVLFVDDDVVASPGLVSGHAARHAGDGPPQLVLGYMPMELGAPTAENVAGRVYAREYEGRCEHYEEDPLSPVRDLWGGNFSMPREAALSIGLANPRFTEHYHADRDFGIRCLDAGVTGVFDRALHATHRHSHTLNAFVRDAASMGAGRVLTAELHPGVATLHANDFTRNLPGPLAALVHAGRRPRAYAALVLGLTAVVRLTGRTRAWKQQELVARVLRRLAQQHGAIEQFHHRRPHRHGTG